MCQAVTPKEKAAALAMMSPEDRIKALICMSPEELATSLALVNSEERAAVQAERQRIERLEKDFESEKLERESSWGAEAGTRSSGEAQNEMPVLEISPRLNLSPGEPNEVPHIEAESHPTEERQKRERVPYTSQADLARDGLWTNPFGEVRAQCNQQQQIQGQQTMEKGEASLMLGGGGKGVTNRIELERAHRIRVREDAIRLSQTRLGLKPGEPKLTDPKFH